MPSYQAESFYRAQIKTPILDTTTVPFTINVSKIPTISNWLVTISPNTEYEEICEYNNPNGTNLTIDIVKRGILPSSILLTTATVDYNNPLYYKEHTQNDVIRGDVNHIHINQGIGNTTLATNTWVGISKLSVAAVDAGDPIVVGTNDPRVGDASTTQKATVKLSVAPVSATEPIVCGDNDPRLTTTVVSANGFAWTVNASNDITVSTTITWMLKGNGTAISLATDWTDFYKPAWVDVTVADGWSWRSTATTNSLIIGGTTTTNPHQSITSWTSWTLLQSNWAWVAPTFTDTIAPLFASSNITNQTSGSVSSYNYPSVAVPKGWLVTISAGNVYSWGTMQIQTSTDNSTWWNYWAAIWAFQYASNVLTAIVPVWYVRAVHWTSWYTFTSSFSVQAF